MRMTHLIAGAALTVLIGALPAMSCTLPQQRPHDSSAKLVRDFSTTAFVNHVTETIGDDVMGYAVALRDPSGRLVANITHGWAQSPCETTGGRPFGLDTVSSWASVTKMITTAAVLNKTRRFISRSRTDPMIEFVPRHWRIGCDRPNDCWRDVRIEHLLSYRGGFRGSVNGPYQTRLQTGQTERPIGQRAYSNENFGIWNYMGAFFAKGRMDQIMDGYSGSRADRDAFAFIATRGIWTSYLQAQIYDKLGIRGACARIDFAGPDHVLLYNYKSGDGADEVGYKPNPVDTPNCTSGGIVMSVRDMSTFVHALANTGKIVSKKQYANHLARTDNKVMGWNGNLATDDGRMHFKAGGSTKKGGHLGAHIVAFSSGYTAAITTNSFARTGTTWKRHRVLRDAYNAALANGTVVLSGN